MAATLPYGPLIIRNVGVQAGGRDILSGVDLTLRPGELCALIGPSGSGKSTLMKVLLGLRTPHRGEVRLGGQVVSSVGPVGYVPQEDALHGTLRVGDALGFAAALRLPELPERARQARVDEVTRQVGLEERLDVRIHRLSGGQRKRVSIAMELLTRPPLLVLDEPTSGLDPGMEAKLMELFATLAHEGRIVLVATHAMESLRRCDALCVLVAGQLACFTAPDAALHWFGSPGFAGIFDQLPTQTPSAWAQRWAGSAERNRFAGRPPPVLRAAAPGVGAPAPGPRPDAPPAPAVPASPGTPPGGTPSGGSPMGGSPSGGAPPDIHAQLAALKAQLGRK